MSEEELKQEPTSSDMDEYLSLLLGSAGGDANAQESAPENTRDDVQESAGASELESFLESLLQSSQENNTQDSAHVNAQDGELGLMRDTELDIEEDLFLSDDLDEPDVQMSHARSNVKKDKPKASLEIKEMPRLLTPEEIAQAEEAAAEQKARRSRRPIWPLIITALIVFIVATGAVYFFIEATLNSAVTEGDQYLDNSMARIQEADAVVIPLDGAVYYDSSIDVTVADDGLHYILVAEYQTQIPQYEALADQVISTHATLDSAISNGEQALTSYPDDEHRQLAQDATDTANYRKEMIDTAAQIVEVDIATVKCAAYVIEAINLFIDVNTDMLMAVEVVAEGGYDSVEEAVSYNRSALEKLNWAELYVADAKEMFPEVDLAPMEQYIAAKRESINLAIESDEALLNEDYDTALAKNEEFKTKDAESGTLANVFAQDPLKPINDAREAKTTQLRTDYDEIRSKATDKDAILRRYLETSTIVVPG